MTYVWFEILFSLIVAAIIGFIIGWLLRGALLKSKINELKTALEQCRNKQQQSSNNQSLGLRSASEKPSRDYNIFAYLDAPEGKADDLKMISGVGKVLEEKLNKRGVYHFWQVASFTSSTIEDINKTLSFSGRIEREEWVQQAKILASGATTEFSQRYNEDET